LVGALRRASLGTSGTASPYAGYSRRSLAAGVVVALVPRGLTTGYSGAVTVDGRTRRRSRSRIGADGKPGDGSDRRRALMAERQTLIAIVGRALGETIADEREARRAIPSQ
jgi:hypothetical protein